MNKGFHSVYKNCSRWCKISSFTQIWESFKNIFCK